MPKPKEKSNFILPTIQHHDAMSWCLRNNIKVSVFPTLKGLKVEVNDNGKIKLSDNYYKNDDACNKCWELYLYIYKKFFNL